MCDGAPRVLVALAHPAMQRFTIELLEREHGCWVAWPLDGDLDTALRTQRPDLVVLDASTFAACCTGGQCGYRCDRMVVIGPEPDRAYRDAALNGGAGGWVPRDSLADELSGAMRAALGCCHGPCPAPARVATSVIARNTVP